MSELGGKKDDSEKVRVELVPVQGILAAARAFTFGAKKYSPWNWMKGMQWLRLYAAVLRHMFEFMIGVTKDKESGLHPLDHALASLLMLQAHVELGLGEDDRPLLTKKLEAAQVPKHTVTDWYVQIYNVNEETGAGVWKDRMGPFVSRYLADRAHFELQTCYHAELYCVVSRERDTDEKFA